MGLIFGAVRLVWFLSVGWIAGVFMYFGGMLLSIVPLFGVLGRQMARNAWTVATLDG